MAATVLVGIVSLRVISNSLAQNHYRMIRRFVGGLGPALRIFTIVPPV